MSNNIAEFIQQTLERKESGADKAAQIIQRSEVIDIDMDKPWSKYGIPVAFSCNIKDIDFAPTEQEDEHDIKLILPGSDIVPFMSENAMRDLGQKAGYKVDFMKKLSKKLQCEVLNEIKHRSDNSNFSFIGSDSVIKDVSTSWREICSHAEIAQVAYNTLGSIGDPNVLEMDVQEYENGVMRATFITQHQEPVTRKKGDILQHGFKIEHKSGSMLKAAIMVKRVWCDNGMASDTELFSWSDRSNGTVERQLEYVSNAVLESRQHFDGLVVKAREMAEYNVEGDPREALLATSRSLGISTKYNDDIVDAWNAEEDSSYWGMVNALTRFATHTPNLTLELRNNVQTMAGNWTREFDMVSARLPRNIAERIGASIQEAN